MEACSGAHHWARQFRPHGHTVRLMAPKFVTPYRMSGKRGKNDAADAAAICEAVSRPNMRFVPVKEEHQQIILMVHRARQGFVEERTATLQPHPRPAQPSSASSCRRRPTCLRREIGAHLEDLPGYANRCIGDLLSAAAAAGRAHRASTTSTSPKAARDDARSNADAAAGHRPDHRHARMRGQIGNGHEFNNGRQFAAWIGLVPGQYSSGGKARLGRITKAGDAYLRSLLVLGARAVLNAARRQAGPLQPLGDAVCASDAATGRRWWPSRRRTRAWPGRC